jgi:hypothetical protein
MADLRPLALLVALGAAFFMLPAGAAVQPEAPAAAQEGNGAFEIVGHEPLFNRGMNAALAVHGDYAYVGSRTDGKPENVNRAGIMIVDISDPTSPEVVNEMGPPLEANTSESSRELRVWQSKEILIALHTNCSELIHGCVPSSNNNFRFYDISGDHAADPQLILEFDRNTHEYFLWQDPFDPDRALMFGGSAGNQMTVWDISPVADGQEPITLYSGSHGYSNGGLHSLSVSNDGTRAYFALLTGGFAVADVSDFSADVENPELRLITANQARPTWSGPGTHSAVKLWGQDWVYVSDEVYGQALNPAFGQHGCPWGWARMIDISDPQAPTVEAEYKLPENVADFCATDQPRPFSSYSAHNPTQTPNIVFSSWHSGGMQAIGVQDPANPVQLAELRQEPLPYVTQEDPVLSSGQDKVVMWSYPIIKDGLIYVADLRNGLYVLRYTGPFEEQIEHTTFVEGNSNQGHALCFEPVLMPKENPVDEDQFLIPDYC